MNQSTDIDVEPATPAAPATTTTTTCGELIRSARETAGFSVEELARQLNLDPAKISALENNEFATLPAPTFVRGYLRGIAHALATDDAPLLAAFARQQPSNDPALTTFTSGPPVQPTSQSHWVRAVSVTLLVIIVVLLGWQGSNLVDYFQSRYADTVPLTPPAPVTAPSTVTDSQYAVIDPSLTDPLTVAITEQFQAQALDLESAAVEPEPSQLSADELAVLPPADDAASGERAAPETLASDNDGDATVFTNGPGDISVNTRADAWVEITDAEGKRLYYDIGRRGRRIEVGGKPPYRLVIGNSQAVDLTYLGSPVDLDRYSREGVARLNLPE
ncbi:MAG: DUF4115 domain-containing protein [Gammaproteobacteria bacterium]|nr:DUF4115 domain-containing protein [Gammaproteobacteria bacterium]